MPGVAISANGVRRAVTDLNGIYSINVYTGTYTLSAARPCFAFSPQVKRHRAARKHRPGLYRPEYVRTSTVGLQELASITGRTGAEPDSGDEF